MIDVIGLAVAVIGLVWGIGYTIWYHRRPRERPALLVRVEPCVFTAGPQMTFVPDKATKHERVKPGTALARAVSIFAYNTGAVILTLDRVAAVPINAPARGVDLVGCWVAVDEKATLPHVMQPGDKWNGLCDWFWLQEKMDRMLGHRAVWNLRFVLRR